MTGNLEKLTADALLASFNERLGAFALDLIVLFIPLLFICSSLQDVVPQHAGWVTLGLILAYFTLPIASPLRGTLGTLAAGLRIVDHWGNTLSLWRAALRSSVLAGLAVGALTIHNCAMYPRLCLLAMASIVLVLLPALTPRRQGVQDIVAGSIVARKDALRRPDAHENIRHVLVRGASRPTVSNILGNVLLISLPAYMLFFAGGVLVEFGIPGRVDYAVGETRKLRSLVEEYYTLEGSFPADAAALGVAVETPYPDGGYYRLEKDGVIRIGFTVIPALKNASILLEPSGDDNGVIHWDCVVHNDLAKRKGYFPAFVSPSIHQTLLSEGCWSPPF